MILRLPTRYEGWPLRVAVVALASAAATFIYLFEYPLFVSGRRGSLLDVPGAAAIFVFTLSMPVVLLVALIWPRRAIIAALQIHAALFASVILIVCATSNPGHSSPGDALAPLIEAVLVGIVAIEIVVMLIALARSVRAAGASTSRPQVFLGLFIPIIGGWVVGVLAWSETVPSRVINAAELAAAGKPYCLDLRGKPATSRRQLTGLAMRAPNVGGWTWEFHATLVVDGGTRSYRNWSYRTGQFEPVSDRARQDLHLDSRIRCEPRPHFALPL